MCVKRSCLEKVVLELNQKEGWAEWLELERGMSASICWCGEQVRNHKMAEFYLGKQICISERSFWFLVGK